MPPDLDSPVIEQPTSAPTSAPPAAPEPPSLRESLEKAIVETPAEPDRTQPERAPTQRERDPFGRFARSAPAGAEVPSADEVHAATQPPEETHEDLGTAQGASIDAPPKSWKSGPRDKWGTLEPDVRAEIHRRERESSRAIADTAPIRKFVQGFQETIQPHAARYRDSGLQPLQVVANLMQSDAILSHAPMPQKAMFMAKLIRDYKIDVAALDAALSGGDPTQEPMSKIEQLISERLAPVQQFVQGQEQQRAQMVQHEQTRAGQLVANMSQDAQNFPHFDLVAQDMADVMEMAAKRQVYLSPQEAYKRAVAMNPEAQAAEQGREGQQRAQGAHDAATRSLGASLSVSGSPAGLRQRVDPGDLRSTIEAAWAAAQGR